MSSSQTRAITTPGLTASSIWMDHQGPRTPSLRCRNPLQATSSLRREVTVVERCKRGGVGRGCSVRELAVGESELAGIPKSPAQHGALLSSRIHLDGGEGLTPFGCPVPSVACILTEAWDVETVDEIVNVATRCAN